MQEQLALQRTRKGGEEEEGEEDVYVRGTRRFLSAFCFITQPSKHSFSPPSGWPFYLLPSFPRWAASTHNLLLFHVWSAVEEDEGLVQVKINEVVYMAYARQETGIPFLFFFLSKVASKMIKKKIMHACTGGAAAVISKFKGKEKEKKKGIFINLRFRRAVGRV